MEKLVMVQFERMRRLIIGTEFPDPVTYYQWYQKTFGSTGIGLEAETIVGKP